MGELIAVVAVSAFSAWVIFFGGAERLEGTITSAFLLQVDSVLWHASGIKVYVALSWLGMLVWTFIF